MEGFKSIQTQKLGQEIANKMLISEFESKRAINEQRSKTPLIVSACPGVVCFGEVNQHTLLPYLSTCPSPPVAQAYHLKNLEGQLDNNEAEIFICVVAPCFDRKLESMRKEFKGAVDCVIGTSNHLKLPRFFKPSFKLQKFFL